MRRFVLSIALLLIFSGYASAQVAPVPLLMNFQGRLARPDGTPVADGNYNIAFSLWNDATATALANRKWALTVAGLSVRNGVFTTQLINLPSDAFNGNLWLQIQIGNDPPLAPRQQLVTSAYAFKANSVPDGAITSASLADGSVTPSKLASDALNNLAWLLNGNAGVTASQFLGTTGNQFLAFRTNNVERMRILANGNIGIGTSAPKSTLHNAGDYYGRGHLILHAFEGDGQNGTAYVQARDDSTTSNIALRLRTKAGTTLRDVMTLTPTGLVGIGTASPARSLHVQSNTYGLMVGNSATGGTNLQLGLSGGRPAIQSVQTEGTAYGILRLNPEGGQVTIGAQAFNNVVFNVANTAEYAIGTDGTVIAGDFVNNSDARLKKDIRRMQNALGSILALDGVTYSWNDAARSAYNLTSDRRIGFIAQNVERVLPDLVKTGPRGTKVVSYIGVVPVLVEAVKTLNTKLEQRDAEVAELKAQVAALAEAVKKLSEQPK